MINPVSKLLKQELQVIDIEQNTPEWLTMRRTKRTASETPIVLGLSPWSSPSKLAIEKFGKTPAKSIDTPATRHGHKHEPRARTRFEALYNYTMNPHVCVRGHYMSSLDGWDREANEILEIKCPFMMNQSDTWVKACDDQIPDHYIAQIQHQLMVSGASVCHFWVFDTQRNKGIRIVVPPNKSYYARILTAWEDFIKKYA